MRFSEVPRGFKLRYHKSYSWSTQPCRLLRLGLVRKSSNPYFATQEKQVQNLIVRPLGSKPLTDYTTLTVERDDSTVWAIQLGNFESYEFIERLENDAK